MFPFLASLSDQEMNDRFPEKDLPFPVRYPGREFVPSASPEDGVSFCEISSGKEDDEIPDPVVGEYVPACAIIPAILSKREKTGLQLID